MNFKDAKGNREEVEYSGEAKQVFVAGAGRRWMYTGHYRDEGYPESPADLGYVVVNGLVRFADGTEAYALLEFDENSSGDHCGTAVFLPAGGVVFQGDPGFLKALEKSKSDVFPYQYKPTGEVRNRGWRPVDPEGWSN